MIAFMVLIITLFLILLIAVQVIRAIIKKQKIIGRPPIPVFFFILAKMLVVVNLTFLLLKGLDVDVYRIFNPVGIIDFTALTILLLGTVVLFLSTVKLNKDLVFGLSDSDNHRLQTTGVYSISRHPFYMGFILILFSSCLFIPNYINILAYIGAWLIHHFIMIKEEQFLRLKYGDEYRQYADKVKRYVTF